MLQHIHLTKNETEFLNTHRSKQPPQHTMSNESLCQKKRVYKVNVAVKNLEEKTIIQIDVSSRLVKVHKYRNTSWFCELFLFAKQQGLQCLVL